MYRQIYTYTYLYRSFPLSPKTSFKLQKYINYSIRGSICTKGNETQIHIYVTTIGAQSYGTYVKNINTNLISAV